MQKDYLLEPEDTPQSWIVFYHEHLPKKSEVPTIGLSNSILHEHCLVALKTAGFHYLSEVKDMKWLMQAAFAKDPALPLYHRDFAAIIERYLETSVLNFVKAKVIAYKAKALTELGGKLKHNTGSNTNAKFLKKYSKHFKIELAEKLKGLFVAPCYICLSNNTKDLQILKCCGNVMHSTCMGEEEGGKCKLCGGIAILGQEIIDLKSVFIDDAQYEKIIADYKAAQSPEEKLGAEELEKALEEIDEKELVKLLKKKGFVKKKKKTH